MKKWDSHCAKALLLLAPLALAVTLVPQLPNVPAPAIVHAATVDDAADHQNLVQRSVDTIDAMPDLPNNFKLVDWKARGKALIDFVFNPSATNFSEKTEISADPSRSFSTIYRDDRYGGYMLPAFYGEDRPLTDNVANNHYGADDQESISVTSGLISASLMGMNMNQELPKELQGSVAGEVKDADALNIKYETYLDDALKFFWTKKGTNIFTNVPNGSMSTLQNMPGAYQAFDDFWYMLIANQNFFRLAYLNKDWRPDLIKDLQEKVADKMVKMVDALGGQNCDFNIQGYDMMNMKVVTTAHRMQPDGAVGTAYLLYDAYNIFKASDPQKAEQYLTYAKYCMDYLDGLTKNPYYENMLIDAVYLANRMNAEQGTHYNTAKYIGWITTAAGSSVRQWGGVNYTADGTDVYGLTGNPKNGLAYFFNSIYPMTSILPAAKYDPSYAKMTGKWALNIVNATRYFLPTELAADHQTDGNYIGKPEGNVMAYEALDKQANGVSIYGNGDVEKNRTTGWKAGKNATNFGLYGGFYTGVLGALVSGTNVSNILQLDCSKTDYYQDDMYQTYLYYNPNKQTENVKIDLGEEKFDLYDSVTGTYLARNVSGQQSFKMLADSARVIVLAPANSTQVVKGNQVYINDKLVDGTSAERTAKPGTDSVANITIEGNTSFNYFGEQHQFSAKASPATAEDSRVSWSLQDASGNASKIASVDQQGNVTSTVNGTVYLVATALDGSGVSAKAKLTITGQDVPPLSLHKPVTVSTQTGDSGGDLAVDGEAGTRWSADKNEDHPWLMVDLEHTSSIQAIRLNWEAARPPKYEVQVSNDGKTWQTIKVEEDEGNTPKVVTVVPTQATEGRFVRVYADEKSSWGASLYEVTVFGQVAITQPVTSMTISGPTTVSVPGAAVKYATKIVPDNATDQRVIWSVVNLDGSPTDLATIKASGLLTPSHDGVVLVQAKAVDGSGVVAEQAVVLSGQDLPNLVLNKAVKATQHEDANPDSHINDGDLGTRWASGRTDNAEVTFDLGAPTTVNKVILQWETASAQAYKLQGSLDGETYSDLLTNNDGQGGVEVETFKPTKVRYLRLQCLKARPGLAFSLWELAAYDDSQVDKTTLKTVRDQYLGLSASGYETSSFAKLQDALKVAEKVVDDEAATQSDVDTSLQTLVTAARNLTQKPEVNFDSLDNLIAKASGLHQADYTGDSWTDLSSALAAAKQLRLTASPTQRAIDASMQQLTDAIQGLKLAMKVDTHAAQAALSKLASLHGADYTKESWQHVTAAATALKAALKQTTTQGDLDKVTATLTSAIGALSPNTVKAQSQNEPTAKADSHSKSSSSNQQRATTVKTKATKKTKLPKTGDQTAAFATATGAMIAFASVMFGLHRRRHSEED